MTSQTATYGNETEEGAGLSLGEIVSVVRRRVWLVVSITALVVLVAAGVLWSLPNRYEAVATVQIDPRKRTIVNIENVTSDLNTETPIVESEVEVLRSRAILVRVVDQLRLRTDPEFAAAGGLGARIRGLLSLSSGTREKDTDKAGGPGAVDDIAAVLARQQSGEPDCDPVTAELLSRIKVNRVRNSLVIEIKVTTRGAMKSARIANAMVDAYIQEQVDGKTRATGSATELLEQKLDGLRQQVVEVEQRVARFKTENNFVDAEGQVLSEKQLARLMEQTVLARNASAEARAKFEYVEKMLRSGADRSGLGEVLASHTIKMLKEQEAKISQQVADLATRYGDKHPQMLKVLAEQQDLRGKIGREVAQIVANIKTEAEVALERERQLGEALEKLKEQQTVMRDATVKLRELEREATTSRQVFESFLGRYKQTAETQGLELPDSRIVERADAPVVPSGPKRVQLLVAAIFAGLIFGLGVGFLVEYAAPGVRSSEEAEQILGTHHLASVPLIRDLEGVGAAHRKVRLLAIEPQSLFAESLRTLRHELDSIAPAGQPRIVLVASALPNEGKSMIASNLAHDYALSGARTLIIDADLRKAELSTALGLEGLFGLADVLQGGCSLPDAIVTDATTGLNAMPSSSSGPIASAAPGILDQPGFARMLQDLKRRFDIIVLDASPLLPVIDGRLVAERADQIVMTVVWRRTPKALARRALKVLGDSANRIAGVVVNQVDAGELAQTLGYGHGPRDAVARGRRRQAA